MKRPDRAEQTYGWVIVAVAMFALVVSNGLTIGGLPPFYKAIREEFVAAGIVDPSWAETFIANGATITFLMSGVFSLIAGWLVNRFPLKWLMVFGCVVLGSGVVLLSRSNSVATFYIARFLMGASLGFVGVAPCVVLVSRWFDKGRGAALGIALTGTSLGGSLIALLSASLIPSYGWRNALLTLSALIWFLLLPAIVLLVGESPSCASPRVSKGDTLNATDGLSFGDAVGSPLFWIFALCSATIFYPIFVTLQQFILYAQTPRIGISAEAAGFGQSALFAIGVGGKFLAGWLSDKVNAAAVMAGFAGLMFLSSLTLLDLTASNALFFLLPFAIGYGGAWVMLQRLASELFGGRDIGKILGAITLVEVTGASIGGRVTGYLADRNGGDYTHAFYGVTIAAGLAFATTVLIYVLNRSRMV
jgi:MFS family permease